MCCLVVSLLGICGLSAKDDAPRGFQPISELAEAKAKAVEKKQLLVIAVKGADDNCPHCATAMKSGEKEKLAVIRLINAALKQREVDERIEITDAIVLAVLEKMVKQRKDSISQFDAAGRDDLSSIEKYELGIIQAYLPEQMSEAEINVIIDEALAEAGVSGPQAMGKVMPIIKAKVAGKADMGVVSQLLKAKLAG